MSGLADGTLAALEAEVWAQGREWTRRRLQERLQTDAEGIGAAACRELRRRQRRSICIDTCAGRVRVQVDYGWDPRQQSWRCPQREAWGLAPAERISPLLREKLCFTAAMTQSYDRAVKVAGQWGVAADDSTLCRLAHAAGATLEALPPRPPLQQSPPEALVIMADGWMMRQRGPVWGAKRNRPGERVAWHDCKTAVIFRLDARAHTAGGRRLIVRKHAVAYQGDPVEFGRRVQQEALRHGLAKATVAYWVSDGAVWLWNLREDRFSNTIGTLDFYHAAEHLHAIAAELFPDNAAHAMAWVEPLLHHLRHGHEKCVLATLDELQATHPNSETIRREAAYFTSHADHIHYRAREREGAPIGSGPVESQCLQLQGRFKGPGKFWSEFGSATLMALYIAIQNEEWDALWGA